MSPSTIAVRLAWTLAAGLVLGLNRSERGQPAGMRTVLLVCTAASLAMIQMDLLSSTPDTHNSIVRLDLMRLPLGILSGMGFIGGGVIVRKGSLVHGVTTAATLWIVTVLGLCFGGGQIGLGAAGTGIALVTLGALKRVETFFIQGHRAIVRIELRDGGPDETAVLGWLRDAGFDAHGRRVELHSAAGGGRMRIEGRYRGVYPQRSIEIVRALSRRDGVESVTWSDAD